MLIREATINDVEIIRQLANEIWWPSYSPIISDEQISYLLRERYSTAELTGQIVQKQQIYLILYYNEQPVGFASYGPREEDETIYKLHKLYCLPSMHGKGCGKVLLNAVIDKVSALGIKILELNVHRQNKAHTFYEKMGFSIAYSEDIPIGPYFLNDYVMRKVL